MSGRLTIRWNGERNEKSSFWLYPKVGGKGHWDHNPDSCKWPHKTMTRNL